MQAATAQATLKLLGPFELIVQGENRSHILTYDKSKILLASLALAQGRPMTRAKLAQMLWPSVEIAHGRARVRHALHLLRTAFEATPGALLIESQDVALQPASLQTDVLELLAAPATTTACSSRRLDLYRGPFLQGLKLPQNETLQAWRQSWTARIEIELAQCRSDLAASHLEQGDPQQALAYAKHWVSRWPEDETGHRQLIRLLLCMGERDAAMHAFEHCRDVLAQRLGVAPSAETHSLLGPAHPPLPVAAAHHSPHQRGYRPLAVLAITLAWQSTLSDDDAEQAMQELEASHQRIGACIRRHGAWLAPRGTDNTLLAYFGFPTVCEHPALRAAGLARAITQIQLHARISVGMGLHADIALAEPGHRPDSGALLCQSALPLAWQARHHEILLSTAGAGRLESRQVATIKRHGHQLHVLSNVMAAPNVPRMHGRTPEFDHLLNLWSGLAGKRTPAVALIHGAPGLGKTLLARTLAEYVRKANAQAIWLECQENFDAAPWHPLACWLWAYASDGDMPQDGLPSQDADALLQAIQARLPLQPDTCSTLRKLLQGDTTSLHLPMLHQALLDAVTAMQDRDLPPGPLLIVCENLQWADAGTLALLQHMTNGAADRPIMLLATAREEFMSPWPQQTLRLPPLDAAAITELISAHARRRGLVKAQRAHIIEHSLGIPLYAEELLQQAARGNPAGLAPRLLDPICARLLNADALVRHVAQLAALIDLPLDADLLAQALGQPTPAIKTALASLARMGILWPGTTGGVQCPPLLRQALGRPMLRHERRRRHGQAASYLIAAQQPAASVAPHLEAADDIRAPAWWRQASADALVEGVPRDAAACLERALELSHRIPDEKERQRFEFECKLGLGTIASALAGPADRSAVTAFEQAAEQCPANDLSASLSALWGQWMVCQNQGEPAQAHSIAQQLLRISVQLDDKASRGWSLYALAQYHIWRGEGVQAEQLLLQSIEALQGFTVPQGSAFGTQTAALVYCSLGTAQALQGRFEPALENVRSGIEQANQGNASVTLAICILSAVRVHYLAGDLALAAQAAQYILHDITQAQLLEPWFTIATAYAVLPQLLEQPNAEQLASLQQALPVIRQGMPLALDSHLCIMARGLIAAHRADEALARLDEAAIIGTRRGSYALVPEIHCLRGDARLALGQPDSAEHEWRQAQAAAGKYQLLAYNAWVQPRLDSLAQQRQKQDPGSTTAARVENRAKGIQTQAS